MKKAPMTFEHLAAWQQARILTREIYTLTRSEEIVCDYGLIGQIRRAGVSAMSNLAEGYERSHIPEKLQFFNVARASTGEVRSLLYVIEDNYAECAEQAVQLRSEANRVGQLISGLIRSTEARKTRAVVVSALAALIVLCLA